jgi:hypothetical protein
MVITRSWKLFKMYLCSHSIGKKVKLISFFFFPESVYAAGVRLCGLVVRVLGYRSGGPASIPGTTRKKSSGLERGPLSLVSTTEELLDRKVATPV